MKILKGKIRKRIEIVLEVDADMATEMDCTLLETADEESAENIKRLLQGNHKLLPFEKIISIRASTLMDDSRFRDKRFYGD